MFVAKQSSSEKVKFKDPSSSTSSSPNSSVRGSRRTSKSSFAPILENDIENDSFLKRYDGKDSVVTDDDDEEEEEEEEFDVFDDDIMKTPSMFRGYYSDSDADRI